jgi:hypothetical protein
MMWEGADFETRAKHLPSLRDAWRYIPQSDQQKKTRKPSQKDRRKEKAPESPH